MLGGLREAKGTRLPVSSNQKHFLNLLCILDLFFQNAGSQFGFRFFFFFVGEMNNLDIE